MVVYLKLCIAMMVSVTQEPSSEARMTSQYANILKDY